MNNSWAPIILFVYNRPENTLKTLEALKNNNLAQESELYIYSDGPKKHEDLKKVEEVRNIINDIKGFKSVYIYCYEENQGLANSVINGVTKVFKNYDKVIVLEDDLLTSKNFLTFINEALNFYKFDNDIWSISGYTPNLSFPDSYQSNIYVSPRASSWGWGTWKDRWKLIDWDIKDYHEFKNNGKSRRLFNYAGNDLSPMLDDQIKGIIDSWAIRWCYNQFKLNKLTVYPRQSFVVNIGFDNDATHGSIGKSKYQVNLAEEYEGNLERVKLDPEIINNFRKKYNLSFYNYIGRALKKIGIYKLIKTIMKKIRLI
ncbi:glycosyltransferase [Salinibacillus aidingensis]|uniref:Glycosyltransferase n=1 Tax=Salinibacillus aidingensis TaxID=237684 RepID=A0ABN1AZB4_9BACI